MVGRLTTHVLDTREGRPAANMEIQLWAVGPRSGSRLQYRPRSDIAIGAIDIRAVDARDEGRTLLKTVRTNADGRTDRPLLVDVELKVGIYELIFAVGDYFAEQSVPTASPPYLDRVPVRFGIADITAHYHVPLLVSPWAYSTYRGS